MDTILQYWNPQDPIDIDTEHSSLAGPATSTHSNIDGQQPKLSGAEMEVINAFRNMKISEGKFITHLTEDRERRMAEQEEWERIWLEILMEMGREPKSELNLAHNKYNMQPPKKFNGKNCSTFKRMTLIF